MSESAIAEIMQRLDRIEAAVKEQAKEAPAPHGVKETYSIKEAAKFLGRSPDWVYDKIKCRVLRPIPIGKPYMIHIRELDRFIRR